MTTKRNTPWHQQMLHTDDASELLTRQKKMREARVATAEMKLRAVEQRKLSGREPNQTAVSPTRSNTHTVQPGETLADIAHHYYGSGTRDKWMTIYELNKQEIGDDPAFIQPGQRLQIPTLT